MIRGRSVWHPMGWDSFGLPAENAAIQKGVDPGEWTRQNIDHMRRQLDSMGFNFNYMEATSQPEFYRWTQWLFLQLLDKGLAYKSYSMVNWDPVDKTVLAKEQIDDQGRSWRSGALVEKRYMKQWFLKTAAFMDELFEAPGLDSTALGWKQLISIQRSWFKKANCHAFYFQSECNLTVPVVAFQPEVLLEPDCCLHVSGQHWLTQFPSIQIKNPFTGNLMKIKTNATLTNDFYGHIEIGRKIADNLSVRNQVLERCRVDTKLGGYQINSEFHDWLVSRQRYWGTPIPIIECDHCGIQPISEAQLPVQLPSVGESYHGQRPISADQPTSRLQELAPDHWLNASCPSCHRAAKRETDTFDTFVDSSWYYLRYAAWPNPERPFDRNKASRPVWLYLGGNEHASGHLFYARFIHHFLKAYGYLQRFDDRQPEPFERILFQGMVNGRTHLYNGQYISYEQAQQLIKSGRVNKRKITSKFEKMSKSKANGVDPVSLVQKYGMDATRYCVLGATSSQKTRNWQGEQSEFYSGMRTLRKLILSVEQFIYARQIAVEPAWAPVVRRFTIRKVTDPVAIQKQLVALSDARNRTIRDVTIAFEFDLKPGAASKRLQELLDFMRKNALNHPIGSGFIYQQCLADLLIMYSPILPHLCEEMWTGLMDHMEPEVLARYDRSKLCSQQEWPRTDSDYGKFVQFTWQPVDSKHSQRTQVSIDASLLELGRETEVEQFVCQTIEQSVEFNGFRIKKLTIYPRLHCDVVLVSIDQKSTSNEDDDDD